MKNYLTCCVYREGQDVQDRKRQDKQDYFWVAGLPCIVHILPDPPAKRILFFFSRSLSCNRSGTLQVSWIEATGHLQSLFSERQD